MSIFEQLAAPFPPDKVSWRVGSSNKKKRQKETGDNYAKATKGQVLAYIDARDVMDRLDEVCGPGGWQNRYTHADKKTICEIGILTQDGEWIWKADGAGESDIEAEKGALSDAFKRSAVRWGVGRYLYHLPTPWVDLDEREQIPDHERRRLEGLLRKDAQLTATPHPGTPPPIPVHERGLFNACKAAIDLCETKADLDHWAKANKLSLERIQAEDAEVHAAVRAHYAKRLLSVTEKVAA